MNRYIGKRLDERYEIKDLIGIGGMADVYRAFDLVEKKEVAVKILKEEYLTNEDFKRRFRNESKAIAVLSHPNIVKIFDVSFEDRIQFIVMEYINGITLKEYIEQQKIVSWKEAVHFTVQILRALQHAHDNGIVHRDVKPQNVMLLQDGTVKVMDFGIARFARDNGRTISEKAIGSVHYISPEQARGDVTDEKTDIYSVGVLLFEMLTGKLPFDGDTPVAVAIKQMQVEAEKPTSLNPSIPEGLEEIVIRAMKKDPDLRYQTAAEMLRDIDEFKRNPNIVFEYKYFIDNGDTKYFDAVGSDVPATINKSNGGGKALVKEKKRISPTMQVLLAVTVACVIIAVIAVVIFFNAIRQPTPEFQMYNFINQKYEDIINNLDAYDKAVIVKGSEELSDQYEAGYVIDQDPKPGSAEKEGTKVTLTISSGLKSKTVPDVYGKDKAEAEQELRNAGFEVNLVRTFSKTVEENKVISTTPAAGETATVGQVINVSYSAGDSTNSVVVPSLLNRTENAAKQQLISLGLVPKATPKDSDKPKGMVVGQALVAGNEVTIGTIVEFYVSNGKPTEQSQTIVIPFAAGLIDESCTFDLTLDGQNVGAVSFNPARDGNFTWSFKSYGDKQVVVKVNGYTFAIININFDTGAQQMEVHQDIPSLQKPIEPSSEPSSEPPSSDVSPSSPSSSQISPSAPMINGPSSSHSPAGPWEDVPSDDTHQPAGPWED